MDDDELVRLYLTGRLDEEAADGLEQRLLNEDDLFELCEAVEADLLAASVRGELVPGEREQVLHRLAASPQGRARLALAKGLTALADGRSETQPLSGLSAALPFRRAHERRFHPALQIAALAASLLILLGGAWLAVQRMDAGDTLTHIAQETPRLESPAPPAPRPEKSPELSTTPTRPAPERAPAAAGSEPQKARPNPVTVLLQISLAVRRSAEGLQQLRIPVGTEQLEIQVDLGGEESYEAFRATLSEPGGDALWTRDSIEPRQMEWGTVLLLDVPARILPSGRYQIEVLGLEPEGTHAQLGIQEFEVFADL
jgi:hypothetical protein